MFEPDKNIDSKDFLKYASSIIITKKNYPIPSVLKTEIQKIAINHLQVKDIFQLRDRFEGQAYMDNLMLKVSALSILEKDTSTSLIDWPAIKFDKKSDFTLIKINNKPLRVIAFFYGTLPVMNSSVKEPIVFCAIRPEFRTGIICGVLKNFSFDNDSLFLTKMGATKNNLKKFIGFKSLVDISDL